MIYSSGADYQRPRLSTYTQPAIAVTDGAEVSITVHASCQSVSIGESSAAAGWPRAFLIRGAAAGSSQQTIAPGSYYSIPGPFAAGDIAATVELVAAGGDSSTFNISELQS